MDVVITGAAGFIGSYLARAFVERGDVVHALVHPRTDAWRLGEMDRYARMERFRLHRVDLNDLDGLTGALSGIWRANIVHTASPGGHVGTGSSTGRVAMWRDTVMATVTLLECLGSIRTQRFVHLGSSLEYRPSSSPLRETDPREPVTIRGAAKVAASVAVSQWAREKGIDMTELRIFRAYGPTEAPDRLVPTLVEALRRGAPVPVPEGTTRRDMVHVDDVVEACIRSIDSVSAAGEVLNVGSGVSYTVDEIIDVFEEVGGRPIERVRGSRELFAHDVEHWQADMTHAREVLGWRPAISLREGVEMVLKAS